MAKKEFNIEDSPAMRFVTDTDVFKKFAETTARVEESQKSQNNQDTVLKPVEAPTMNENEKSEQSIILNLPKRKEPRNRSLTIKIPVSLYDKVKTRADSRDVSVTEYIIQSLLLVIEKIDVDKS